MNLIPVRNANLPITRNTAYKWLCTQRYPGLLLKVAGKLFFDLDEWLSMAEQARKEQVDKAARIDRNMESRA